VRRSVKRWLREPLLHFLVAGALLFAGYRALHPESRRTNDENRIELTADDLRQLEIAWATQWRRPPTPDEMRGLVDARVREEILYREALALGLEQGDAIVKRRLAQKMEFLAGDVSMLPDPSTAAMRAWYANNAERFAEPARRSFRHVYFSTDLRGLQARVDAMTALSRLSGNSADAPATNNIGDAFMFQNQYADRSPEQIASIFGSPFAAAVGQARAGSWQGPIESGLGWHLVFVVSVTPGRVPPYDEIEAQVKAAWLDEQRSAARQRTFEAMKAHYDIRLPPAPLIAAAPRAPATETTP